MHDPPSICIIYMFMSNYVTTKILHNIILIYIYKLSEWWFQISRREWLLIIIGMLISENYFNNDGIRNICYFNVIVI